MRSNIGALVWVGSLVTEAHALAWPNPPYYVSSEALTDGYDTCSIVASSTIGISRFGCYLGGRFERALIWSASRCG